MSARRRPTAVGLFSGAGGLDIGLQAAGFRIALKNLVADQAVRGLHELPYFFPTTYYDVHTQNSHVPVGFRRATGSSVSVFYLESFIDELAHAAGKDPYEYRRELVARNTKFRDRDDWLKALDMVAKMSGWGTPLPVGWARGIGVDDRRRPSR